jgi:hypothetical protein
MGFESILFEHKDSIRDAFLSEPAYFKDLYLDQIIGVVIHDKKQFELEKYFYTPLHSQDAIEYRQRVMLDLEDETLRTEIDSFADFVFSTSTQIEAMKRDDLNNYFEKGRLHYLLAKYCQDVKKLVDVFTKNRPMSIGLRNFADYLAGYAKSSGFTKLDDEAIAVKADLSTVHYGMLLKENTIRIRKFENEPEHNLDIERLFSRFNQGEARYSQCKPRRNNFASHVEANILFLLAKWYPDAFARLDRFCANYRDSIDGKLLTFSKEIQFYLAYHNYIARFKENGLRFCYPKISAQSKAVFSIQSFDLALATKLMLREKQIVCNDFYLQDIERIIVITGPNQGGKTTFARTFGQLHHLASLGCPVPGNSSTLFLFNMIYTHFGREENIETLNGKLQDDLVRMHEILSCATGNSIIIINEILSSTSLMDGIVIGKKLMDQIAAKDCICLYVTFLDELASYCEKNVSMVSTVLPEDPVQRTYKIVRQKANGLAYAIHVANKYGLTHEGIKGRIKE